jgi:exonuclease VII small subunit
MRYHRSIVVAIAAGCCLTLSMSVADDSPPTAVKPEPASIPAPTLISHRANDDLPVTVEQELDELKAIAKKLDRRIRRLEALLEYERAVQARGRALEAWQKLNAQRENDAGFAEKERLARERYFKARADTERALQQVGEFLK